MPIIREEDNSSFESIKLVNTITTNTNYIIQMFKKLKLGFSPIIAICGCQRIGKSFVGVYLSDLVMKAYNKEYDPVNHTFYEPDKTIEKLEFRNKEPLMIDEASDILDTREWYKKTHQALKSIINNQGYKTIAYIFIAPFITDIDKAFIKHFDFILRVDSKGRYKSWKCIKKYNATTQNRASYPLYLGECGIKLSDVPKNIWKKYEKYSKEEKEKLRLSRLNSLKKTDKNLSIDDRILLNSGMYGS